MTFIKSELEWLKTHARQDDNGAWWCRKTNAPIAIANVGRSIHFPGLPGTGSGEVRAVTHFACSGCEPNKKPPRYGEPITEDKLTEWM